MKKFAFTLQTVLSVKESLEQQQKDAIKAIEATLNLQQTQLQELHKSVAEAKQTLREKLRQGSTATVMASYNNYFKLLDNNIKAKEREIENTENEKKRAQRLLTQVMRERKSLDILKEKQLKEYKIEQTRESEREIGEFLSAKVTAKKKADEQNDRSKENE